MVCFISVPISTSAIVTRLSYWFGLGLGLVWIDWMISAELIDCRIGLGGQVVET